MRLTKMNGRIQVNAGALALKNKMKTIEALREDLDAAERKTQPFHRTTEINGLNRN